MLPYPSPAFFLALICFSSFVTSILGLFIVVFALVSMADMHGAFCNKVWFCALVPRWVPVLTTKEKKNDFALRVSRWRSQYTTNVLVSPLSFCFCVIWILLFHPLLSRLHLFDWFLSRQAQSSLRFSSLLCWQVVSQEKRMNTRSLWCLHSKWRRSNRGDVVCFN